MAQKVFVEMVDDLDGSAGEDVTTVGFSLDGRSYEIDLNSRNAGALRDSLADFIAAGRRQRGSGGTRPASAPAVRAAAPVDAAARERAQAIREWAKDAGHEVSARGRIPAAVAEAYEDAQRVESKPAAARPAKASAKESAKPAEKRVAKSAKKTSKKADSEESAAGVRLPSFSG
ncbi:MAG TPA: Lsr2 family protein [Pseudonocardia sp.]|jgi:hypothetical protein